VKERQPPDAMVSG